MVRFAARIASSIRHEYCGVIEMCDDLASIDWTTPE
jgi:hypothetical protein